MSMKPELLAFHFIWNHPVAFRDFFIPQAWNRKMPYKTRLYQQPIALAKTKIEKTGRGIGKSIDLEMSILHMALLKPGEETIISSFRRVHIKDRCEAIIKYYLNIPYLRNFVDWRHLNRTPVYTIPLVNGNTIYGASVGDDPNAVAIIGKHPSTRAIDEMEVFPREAWVQFIEARAERGSDDIFVGVPNGIIGMPFTDIQKNESYKDCFFRVSRMNTPFWDQKRKQDAIAFCGPELSDNFKQQIHGEDGSPVQGVWPIETIMRQMSKKRQLYVKDVTAEDYKGNAPEGVLYDLPFNADPVVIGIDVGYTEPTVICVFVRVPDRNNNYKYRLIARVNLKNKMIFRDQEEIIDYICQYYNTQYIGIDVTGGDGREILDTMQNPKDKYAINGYQEKMIGVFFNKKVVKAYMSDGTEVEEETKVFATIQLIKMFINEEFELPYDEDILGEFSQERKKKTESARVIYTSTTTDHIISAFRCFAIARYTKELLQLPDTNREYALPVWGEGVIYGT